MEEYQKQDKKEPEKQQTYQFANMVFTVTSVFKETDERTLLHSLGKMVQKDLQNS